MICFGLMMLPPPPLARATSQQAVLPATKNGQSWHAPKPLTKSVVVALRLPRGVAPVGLGGPLLAPQGQEAAAGLTQNFAKKLLERFGRAAFSDVFCSLCGPLGLAAFRAEPFETQGFGFARRFFLKPAFGRFAVFFARCFLVCFRPGGFTAVRGKPFETQGFGFARQFFLKSGSSRFA